MSSTIGGAWRAIPLALVSCALLHAAPALAQEGASIEEVVVTGSRIQRANLTQPNPVTSLDSEDIKLSGELSVVDVLDDLPQLFSSTNSAQASFFTQDGVDASPGVAVLDLRGLGSARTLTLVDGRRHVAGQAGTQAVDVQSIPAALVERVEVLTGGASSVYGADAVSGVVNFIMKDDFEGTQLDFTGGVAEGGGGEEYQVSFTHGRNLFDDRLNITFNATARSRQEIYFGERSFARNGRQPANRQEANWRRFFQPNDPLPPGAAVGDPIASGFGTSCLPVSGNTDPSLVARACNAAPSAVQQGLTFGLTSPRGLLSINLADDITAATPERAAAFPFFHTEADLANLAAGTPIMDFNNNGVDDCSESYVGALAVGGCVVVGDDGSVRPFNPGLVDGDINFDAVGGDGFIQAGQNDETIDPQYEQLVVNTLINFELTDSVNLFADVKWVKSETKTFGGGVSFHDTINISPENPFVPQEMQDLLDEILALNPQFTDTAQFFMSRDPIDINNESNTERETFRIVTGIEFEFWDTWTGEFAFNYGRTEEDFRDRALLPDRYFAALDVVAGPGGVPVCRSEVEEGWTVNSFNNDSIFGDTGVNTFTPGDGSCQPANPFGVGNISVAAQDFVAPFRAQRDEIEQTVYSAIFSGDTSPWFSLPAGPIGLAAGAEYREEQSDARPDFFEQAGFYFNSQTSPVSGEYDVTEFFIEGSVPVLADVPFFKELTVDGSFRLSDYSLDVGETESWAYGGSWAPVDDIRFRGTVSRAVRAPNIFELFSPQTQAIFNLDIDPCDQDAIDALSVSDPATAALRSANCAADPLVGPNFDNPLTSNFQGRTGGNPALFEETSDAITYGVVIQPRFLDGLTITADYWEFEIEDAIREVEEEDVLRGCYDSATPFPGAGFCADFTRISDPTSGFFGGLNFLQTGFTNFAALETSGWDFEVRYDMDLGNGVLQLGANGTYLDELVEFRDALDPTNGDPEDNEWRRPKWAANFSARYALPRATVSYQGRFIDSQFQRLVENNQQATFENATTGVAWVHDISGTYEVNETVQVYGGVQNLTDVDPFDSGLAFPVSPRGRYFFMGLTANL